MGTVERFRELFLGREDVWGAVHGECMRDPITMGLWDYHLNGHGSLGVYPLTERDGALWVKWGCTDIDRGYELIPMARNLRKALTALGITSWVERTKGKGYHVWVLCQDWVPAEHMRRALLFAHQVAGVPPTEVNPKQTDLSGLKGYGNYVNLPYSKDYADQGRRVVIDPDTGETLGLADFIDQAEATLNAPDTIARAAALYTPPPPPKPVSIHYEGGDLDPIVRRLSGLAFTIFNDGPTDRFGYDRSRTLQRLAFLCHEDGLNPTETYAVVWDADGRWGKFHDRADGDQRIVRMVEIAFAEDEQPATPA